MEDPLIAASAAVRKRFEAMNHTVAGSGQYIVLPPCVDENGHRFEVGPSRIAVCVRCGYIRSNQ